MSRRGDDVWATWFALTDNARPPIRAPRPSSSRTPVPIGVLALAAVAVLVGVTVLRGHWGPEASTALASATPCCSVAAPATPASSQSASPAGTKSPSPSVGVSTSPSPLGTPLPGDREAAIATARAYEDDLFSGHYQAAWNMLAPEYRSMWAYGDFASNMSAVVRSNRTYSLGEPSSDWVSINPELAGGYQGDFGRAFLIRVQWGQQPQAGTWPIMILFPNAAGVWVVAFDPLIVPSRPSPSS
jgi:hypothetical protein